MPLLLAHPLPRHRHLFTRTSSGGVPRRLLLGALALVAGLGLLAALGRVLREAVHQGELRREATARHSAATWRCNSLPSMRMRNVCLSELNAPPPREVLIAAQPAR